ncbi:MAG: hypothetical protein JW754_05290 [Candidatus Aenigmarchaeota archaeon]|nr:hypothetical protein [Candidatus Aenigmarchaeota archaeon]
MAYQSCIRINLKKAGYILGPLTEMGREIIPVSPISFGYPNGEGFGWIMPDDHITPDINGNPHKKREWDRVCDILDIENSHSDSLRRAWDGMREEIKQKIYKNRHKRMMGR